MSERLRRSRARRRQNGLREVRLWLPDTSTAEFAAQVRHDIETLAKLSPEVEAMLDAWERASAEVWPEWTGPDLTGSE